AAARACSRRSNSLSWTSIYKPTCTSRPRRSPIG
ncbi:MAG: hypothetical protein, partial [Olavius algarvensis Gamma 1 endosymbiont]